jgi:FkbM family methyltransferase
VYSVFVDKVYRKMLRLLHKIFAGKGLWRLPLVPFMYNTFYYLSQGNGLELTKFKGLKLYVDKKDVGVGRHIVVLNNYQEFEMDLFESKINKGDLIVDIGANIGTFTLLASKVLKDTGTVYSFEPCTKNFEILKRNVELNKFNNVKLFNNAVSSKSARSRLFIDKFASGSHALEKANVHFLCDTEMVDTVALDDVFADPGIVIDILKTDTQGHEEQIISGAKTLLENARINKILMEFYKTKHSVLVYLMQLGYDLYNIDADKKELIGITDSNVKSLEDCDIYCELRAG